MNVQTKARDGLTVAKAPDPRLPALADGESGSMVPAIISAPRMYPGKIAKALLAVTREVGAISKGGENTFHRYFYQKWEDVLDRIAPLITEHGLIIVQSETARGLFDNDRLISITYEFTIVNEDGDVWPDRPIKTAVARLVDQKGVADDKAANKCHTAASKYFYLQLFKIKTRDAEVDDADADARPAASAARPKPPNPSAAASAPNAPHTLPTNKKTTFASFAADYVKAVSSATTVEEMKEWEQLNDSLLATLEERAPEIFDDMAAKVGAHAGKLAQASKPQQAEQQAAQPAGRKPPNPNAPDKMDIPANLSRADPAKLKAQLLGRITGFETAAECFEFAKEIEARIVPLDAAGRTEIRKAYIDRQQEMIGND